jgi:hypothetical protein
MSMPDTLNLKRSTGLIENKGLEILKGADGNCQIGAENV